MLPLKAMGCLSFVLLPEAILMSVAHAIAGNSVGVLFHPATDHKGQGSFFCSGMDDWRLTVKNERQRNDLDRKPLKRTLGTCDRNAKV